MIAALHRNIAVQSSKILSAAFVLAVTFTPHPVRGQTTNTAPVEAPPPPPAVSTPTAAMINSMDALNDRTYLNIGDQLSYRVIEEEKDPIHLTISDSGELAVPLLGRFPAAGKTCKQLASELKPLLEKDYFYKATVIIGLDNLSTRSPGKVYFMGQVHSTGALEIPADKTLTLSKAILLNGGLSDFADRRKVKILRKKPDGTTETIVVDLKEILDEGHSEKDPILQPDDTINVPEKLINF